MSKEVIILLVFFSFCFSSESCLIAQINSSVSYEKVNDNIKRSLIDKKRFANVGGYSYLVISCNNLKGNYRRDIAVHANTLLASMEDEYKIKYSQTSRDEGIKKILAKEYLNFSFSSKKALKRIFSKFDHYSINELKLYEKTLNLDSIIDKIIVNRIIFKRLFRTPDIEKPKNFRQLVENFELVKFKFNDRKEERMFAHILFNYGTLSGVPHNSDALNVTFEIPQFLLEVFEKRHPNWEPDFGGG